ncbi:MAG: hypothetical protein GTN59_04235 [Candidatus Dadabacteria bacterium]|nr:hypothetical protein [Candidatus Dadabacteria bacterium]
MKGADERLENKHQSFFQVAYIFSAYAGIGFDTYTCCSIGLGCVTINSKNKLKTWHDYDSHDDN